MEFYGILWDLCEFSRVLMEFYVNFIGIKVVFYLALNFMGNHQRLALKDEDIMEFPNPDVVQPSKI